MFKERLVKAGEGYYSKTMVELETNIKKLANKSQNVEESIELEHLSRKKKLQNMQMLMLIGCLELELMFICLYYPYLLW